MNDAASAQPVQVLVVDHDENSFLIVRDLLRDSRYGQYAVHWAPTYAHGMAELQSKRHQVALIDGRLGSKTGIELLSQARGSGCRAPMILITEQDDHDVNLAALQAGATDYLAKGEMNAALLERVIRYSVEGSRREEALQAALGRSALLSTTLSNLSDGVLITDAQQPDNPAVFANATFSAITGYSAPEVLGRNCRFLQGPDSDPATVREIRRAIQEQRPFSGVILNYRKDGTPFWNALKIAPIFDDDGKLMNFVGLQSDVTAQRQAEASLQENETKFRTIFETSLDAILLADDAGSYLDVNPAACDLVGRTREELLQEGVECLALSEDREELSTLWREFLRQGSQVGEFSLRRPDGMVRETEYRAVANLLPGVHMAVMRDITERKQAEAALRESEANLRAAQQIAHLGSWELELAHRNSDNRIPLRWSEEAFRIFGYQPGEIEVSRENFYRAVHPEDLSFVRQAMAKALTLGQPYSIDHRIILPDGSERVVHEQAELVSDASGVALKLVGTVQDITKRKKVEELLRIGEERFQMMSRATNDAVWDWDLTNGGLWWNEGFKTLFGYQDADIEPDIESWASRVHADEAARVSSSIHEVIESGQRSWSSEYRFRRADGSYADIFDRGFVIHDEQGRPVRMVGSMQDISERKQAVEALRQSNELLHAITEGTPDAIFAKDLEGRYLTVNAVGAQHIGKSIEEIVGKSDYDLLPPEVARLFAEPDRLIMESGIARIIEKTVGIEGFEHTYQTFKGPLRDRQGNVAGLVGVARDITERKQAEEALRESEIRFRRVAESNMIGLFFWDHQGHITDANEAFLQQVGYTRHEMEQGWLRWTDLTPAAHRTADQKALREMDTAGICTPYEKEFTRKDGSLLPIVMGAAMLNEGRSHGVAFVLDITKRKQDETALRHRVQFEALVAQISTSFLELRSDEVDKGVERALQSVGAFVHAERAHVALYSPDRALLFKTHTWCQPEIDLPLADRQGLAVTGLPWYLRQIAALQTIYVPQVAALPEAVQSELQVLEGDGVQSLVIVPLLFRGRAIGHLGLETIGHQQQWSEDDITLLRLVGEMFVLALRGKKAEEELRQANEKLEERVQQRTLQLEEANRALRAEVDMRGLAQARLRESEARYRGIVEGQTEMICRFKADGAVTFANDVYCRYFHKTREEVLAYNFLEPFLPEDREAYRRYLGSLSPQQPTGYWEGPVAMPGGFTRWQQWTTQVFYDEQERLVEFQAVGRDITARREAEEALARAHREAQLAREVAEQANRAKSEFLSRMSHELRTPLNAILGFGQLLEMDDLPPRRREGVSHILKAGHHLLALINEVLDISRIEAGNLALSLEPVPVALAVSEVLQLMQPQATNEGIRFINEVPANSKAHFLADRQRLKQVLLNLSSNAIKYNSEDGTVLISHEEAAQPGFGRLSVRDSGWGLSPDDLQKLFTPFERLRASEMRIEGTGIGLVLCKSLIEVMGGRIGVDSTLGQGSTFWIELPMAEAPEYDAQLPLDKVQEAVPFELQKTVLYIEDNLPNLHLVEMLLEDWASVRLLTAIQGSTGLDMALQHQPDLILLDLHLPDINGDEVLRRLKARESTASIPVVIISADATPEQISRLLAAGAREYITKPIDIKRLMRLLEESIR